LAGIEGKLKEKFESVGLAFLCLSTGHLSPFDHWCKFENLSYLIFLLKSSYFF